jgi:hypothetical protein
MTDIYLVPYHSEPGLHTAGSTGQFAIVENAIVAQEWPYDNGDDPSFYVARRGGLLTWGVCLQQLRNSLKIGSIFVFFSYTTEERKARYRLSAVATVSEKLDRSSFYRDERFRRHRQLYLNLIVKPSSGGWLYDENNRDRSARHKDWLWRISRHGNNKKAFAEKYRGIYEAGRWSDGDVQQAKNYVVFSTSPDETYLSPRPPEVAIAIKGQHEDWTNRELQRLTVGIAGQLTQERRDFLRTENPSGRNVHPQIRFSLELNDSIGWRQLLISAIKFYETTDAR